MLWKAMSPTEDGIAPPLSVVSPFQSCQAQKLPPAVLNPSGWVLCGDTITYCALRLAAAVMLPKCDAAATATVPIWFPFAWPGAAEPVFAHTPASAPPVGYPTCGALAGQVCELVATPSQYWVITPDHSSLLVPMPLNSCCSRGATPVESLANVVLPLPSLPAPPHCEPQEMRYTFSLPVVAPVPSTPPPSRRLFADAAGAFALARA